MLCLAQRQLNNQTKAFPCCKAQCLLTELLHTIVPDQPSNWCNVTVQGSSFWPSAASSALSPPLQTDTNSLPDCNYLLNHQHLLLSLTWGFRACSFWRWGAFHDVFFKSFFYLLRYNEELLLEAAQVRRVIFPAVLKKFQTHLKTTSQLNTASTRNNALL